VLNCLRRGAISRAEDLAGEAEALAGKIGGWHAWLWDLRLKQARAEWACARREWGLALELAEEAVSGSRARGRSKYVVVGLEARAKSLSGLGRKREAIKELGRAVALARAMGDPALFLRAATTLLSMEGDNALQLEARETAARIWAELPDQVMRSQFENAEPVRRLGPLSLSPAPQSRGSFDSVDPLQ